MAAHLTCSWCTNETREILARGGVFSSHFVERCAANMRAEREAEPMLVKCSIASCTAAAVTTTPRSTFAS